MQERLKCLTVYFLIKMKLPLKKKIRAICYACKDLVHATLMSCPYEIKGLVVPKIPQYFCDKCGSLVAIPHQSALMINTYRVNCGSKYILVRDDVENPEGVKCIQMSKDIAEIFVETLEKKKVFKDDLNWLRMALGIESIRCLNGRRGK